MQEYTESIYKIGRKGQELTYCNKVCCGHPDSEVRTGLQAEGNPFAEGAALYCLDRKVKSAQWVTCLQGKYNVEDLSLTALLSLQKYKYTV